jgi:uncharacterized protein with ATP-grasp and redox domains
MNSEPMCVPCVIKQCERLVFALYPNDKGSEKTQEILSRIRHHALDIASELSLDDPPSKFTSQVLSKAYELLNTDDPYQSVKQQQNEIGKNIYNLVRNQISKAQEPIHTAIKFAASGNIIDVGPAEIYLSHNPKVPYLDEINQLVSEPLAIDNYDIFREKFRRAERILYILDNTGEIYLDKLLIERIKGPEIMMVVKASAILNDATKEDAIVAGLDSFGKIITVNDNRCRYLGVDFTCVSEEFAEAFETADIIIAKGHANFESLIDIERDCFFMLMAKCPVVARKLDVKLKDRIFYYSSIKRD